MSGEGNLFIGPIKAILFRKKNRDGMWPELSPVRPTLTENSWLAPAQSIEGFAFLVSFYSTDVFLIPLFMLFFSVFFLLLSSLIVALSRTHSEPTGVGKTEWQERGKKNCMEPGVGNDNNKKKKN